MNAWESFEQIKVQKDGPAKKFALIKQFGPALRQTGVAPDPKTLSCQELEAKIAVVLDRAAKKSGYKSTT